MSNYEVPALPGHVQAASPDAGVSLSRRGFIGVAAGAIAARPALASGQPPVAGELAVDQAAVHRVSAALVGDDGLDGVALSTLVGLLAADPDRVTAFNELAQLDDTSDGDALESMSPEARALVDEIVRFWYLGEFDGEPVGNRADLVFSLPVWRTVPHAAQPALCKAFGYWAMDVTLT